MLNVSTGKLKKLLVYHLLHRNKDISAPLRTLLSFKKILLKHSNEDDSDNKPFEQLAKKGSS